MKCVCLAYLAVLRCVSPLMPGCSQRHHPQARHSQCITSKARGWADADKIRIGKVPIPKGLNGTLPSVPPIPCKPRLRHLPRHARASRPASRLRKVARLAFPCARGSRESPHPVWSFCALIARSCACSSPQATAKKQFLVPISDIVADMGKEKAGFEWRARNLAAAGPGTCR